MNSSSSVSSAYIDRLQSESKMPSELRPTVAPRTTISNKPKKDSPLLTSFSASNIPQNMSTRAHHLKLSTQSTDSIYSCNKSSVMTEAQKFCANRLNVDPSECNSYGVFTNRSLAISLAILKKLALSSWVSVTPQMLNNLTGSLVIDGKPEKIHELNSHDFDGLIGISHLRIRSHNFSELPSELLFNFNRLIKLELCDLPFVKKLPLQIFQETPYLYDLTITGLCFQTRIPEGLFKNTSFLSHLNMSLNQLTSLSVGHAQHLSGLSTLNLSNNYLSDRSLLKNSLRLLTCLTTLNLSNNCLKTLPFDEDVTLFRLMQLNLSNNRLTNLPKEGLPTLPLLTFLDLSYNTISSIPDGFFDQSYQISEVSVCGNPLVLSTGFLNRFQEKPTPFSLFFKDSLSSNTPPVFVQFTDKRVLLTEILEFFEKQHCTKLGHESLGIRSGSKPIPNACPEFVNANIPRLFINDAETFF